MSKSIEPENKKLATAWGRRFSFHSSEVVLVFTTGAFIWIAAVDWITTYELSLSPFYLVLVLIVTWHCGWKWGLAFAVLSVANQMAVGLALGHGYSQPMYFFVMNFNKLFSSVVVVGIIARLKTLHLREKNFARVDFLTTALNNMGFYESLTIEMARHRRDAAPFALIYFDCDNFKEINDRLGHKSGDELLTLVVQTLKNGLRRTDVIARLGGDEFVVVLPKSDLQIAEKVVTKLREELAQAVRHHGFPVTFSVGVGIFFAVPNSEDAVVTFTDQLMYQVKANGKNNVKFGLFGAPA